MRFVDVAKLIGVVPLNVTVLLPRLIVRTLLLLDDRDVAVTLKLLLVKVPAVMVSVLLVFKASLKETEPPEVLSPTILLVITFPLLVIVVAVVPVIEKEPE